MSSVTPLIYAELLSNIRQISVIAALDAPCDSTTGAELSVDGRQFSLHHGGQLTTLNLPGQAVVHLQLQKPGPGNKEISWRLPLAGQASRASIEDAQSNDVPWSAKDLSKDAEFACRECKAVLVKAGTIKVWKDLPSENWAEMMDFWHCHKPDVPASEDDASGSSGQASHGQAKVAASKGYGASTKFLASNGVGLVDIATFLLVNEDCVNIKITDSSYINHKYQPISCTSCHCIIGEKDNEANGIRLQKWRLKLTTRSSSASLSPSDGQFATISWLVSARVSAVMRAQCSSKILLMPATPQSSTTSSSGLKDSSSTSSAQCPTASYHLPEAESQLDLRSTSATTPVSSLLLWVLTPHVLYSFTASSASASLPASPSATPKLAMKVFWKVVSSHEAAILLDSDSVEDLELQTDGLLEIERCLRESAVCLPPSARKFKEWDVGLLDRYQQQQ